MKSLFCSILIGVLYFGFSAYAHEVSDWVTCIEEDKCVQIRKNQIVMVERDFETHSITVHFLNPDLIQHCSKDRFYEGMVCPEGVQKQ